MKARFPKRPHTQSVTCLVEPPSNPPSVNSPFHASAVWKNFYICLQKSAPCLDREKRKRSLFFFVFSPFFLLTPDLPSAASDYRQIFPLRAKLSVFGAAFRLLRAHAFSLLPHVRSPANAPRRRKSLHGTFFFFPRVLACYLARVQVRRGKRQQKGRLEQQHSTGMTALFFLFSFFLFYAPRRVSFITCIPLPEEVAWR